STTCCAPGCSPRTITDQQPGRHTRPALPSHRPGPGHGRGGAGPEQPEIHDRVRTGHHVVAVDRADAQVRAVGERDPVGDRARIAALRECVRPGQCGQVRRRPSGMCRHGGPADQEGRRGDGQDRGHGECGGDGHGALVVIVTSPARQSRTPAPEPGWAPGAARGTGTSGARSDAHPCAPGSTRATARARSCTPGSPRAGATTCAVTWAPSEATVTSAPGAAASPAARPCPTPDMAATLAASRAASTTLIWVSAAAAPAATITSTVTREAIPNA